MTDEPQNNPGVGRPGAALDLDGVLIDGMPFHFKAFDAALRTFGVVSAPREVALLEGMRTREVIRLVANAHGVYPPDSALDDAERLKRDLYSEIFEPLPLPGAHALLSALTDYGCRLAIVTGTAEKSARAAVSALGIEDQVEVIVSHDSNIPLKPDPAPFATAATQLQLSVKRCLAIENAPAGVTSAVAAGLPCLAAATYLEVADLSLASRVFDTIEDLSDWLIAENRLSSAGEWLT